MIDTRYNDWLVKHHSYSFISSTSKIGEVLCDNKVIEVRVRNGHHNRYIAILQEDNDFRKPSFFPYAEMEVRYEYGVFKKIWYFTKVKKQHPDMSDCTDEINKIVEKYWKSK